MITKTFRCELPKLGRPLEGADCEDNALEYYAEMTRQGYECRIEKYDSYIEDEINDRLLPAVEYAVGCTAPMELLMEQTARERFLENIEKLEVNSAGNELCPMDISRRTPTTEELRNCEEISSWQASEEIAEYVRDNESSESDRQRLVAALVKAVEVTLDLGADRIGIMNRNGVKLWSAFEVLAKHGRADDGITVPILMRAVYERFHDQNAIVALAAVAPGSDELAFAREIAQPQIPRYLSGTVDTNQGGKIVESRISYYGAISVIAPGSEAQIRAWENLCGNWDEYPDMPWVANYLGKLEPFCSRHSKGASAAAVSKIRMHEQDLGYTAMVVKRKP